MMVQAMHDREFALALDIEELQVLAIMADRRNMTVAGVIHSTLRDEIDHFEDEK